MGLSAQFADSGLEHLYSAFGAQSFRASLPYRVLPFRVPGFWAPGSSLEALKVEWVSPSDTMPCKNLM